MCNPVRGCRVKEAELRTSQSNSLVWITSILEVVVFMLASRFLACRWDGLWLCSSRFVAYPVILTCSWAYVPHSAKFFEGQNFCWQAFWKFSQKISINHNWRFWLATFILWRPGSQFLLLFTVATAPCSPACLLFANELCLKSSQFHPLELINYPSYLSVLDTAEVERTKTDP